jgi:hypothetical protein
MKYQQHSHGRKRRTLLIEATHTGKKKENKPQQLTSFLSPATVIHCEQDGCHTATTEREETLLIERTKNKEKNSTAKQMGEKERLPPGTAAVHRENSNTAR